MLSILPYVHFSTSSQHSIILPKAIRLNKTLSQPPQQNRGLSQSRKCPKSDTGLGESFNIPGVSLRQCGQMLVTKTIIHFYLLSRKIARNKDRKGGKKMKNYWTQETLSPPGICSTLWRAFFFCISAGRALPGSNQWHSLALFHRDQSRQTGQSCSHSLDFL